MKCKMRLRGREFSIVDLRCETNSVQDNSANARVLILNTAEGKFGFVVDMLESVVSVEAQRLFTEESQFTARPSQPVRGQVMSGTQVIYLLDSDAVRAA